MEEALKVPRALVDNYAGKPTTPLNLAAALNIKPTSGGFRNLCGSAIAYALTSGGSNTKEISVEPLGRRILAPLEEGDDLSAKREAALKPRVLGEFMRKYDGSALPRRDIALNVLHEMGVSQERPESVYTMILDTSQSVGFIKQIKDTQYLDLGGTSTATVQEGVSEDFVAVDGDGIPAGLPVPETPNNLLAGAQGKELGQGIFIEDHPKYADAVGPFFDSLASEDFQAITSVITLLEVLVHPLRDNNPAMAARYREILLHTEGLSIEPLNPEIAEEAAQLRASYGIRTPDAIQLATAAQGSASFIITNDSNLPSVSGMQVLVLDQLL